MAETRKIAIGTAIGAVLVIAVFAVIGRLDRTVVLGTLLGYLAAVGNFFLMAYGIQQSVVDIQSESEENAARGRRKMSLSYTSRRLMQAGILIVAIVSPLFNWIATAIILVIPSAFIVVRQLLERKNAAERTDRPNG